MTKLNGPEKIILLLALAETRQKWRMNKPAHLEILRDILVKLEVSEDAVDTMDEEEYGMYILSKLSA